MVTRYQEIGAARCSILHTHAKKVPLGAKSSQRDSSEMDASMKRPAVNSPGEGGPDRLDPTQLRIADWDGCGCDGCHVVIRSRPPIDAALKKRRDKGVPGFVTGAEAPRYWCHYGTIEVVP